MGYGILPRVGGGGSFQDKANQFSGNAINARSRMQPGSRTETTPPGKTAGGALMAGAGTAASGALIGAQIGSVGGAWGAAIGAGIGLTAYFLS